MPHRKIPIAIASTPRGEPGPLPSSAYRDTVRMGKRPASEGPTEDDPRVVPSDTESTP